MTRQEFVEKWRHELGGLVADGYTNDINNGQLAMKIRNAFRTIDKILGQIYSELSESETIQPQTNGKPLETVKGK